MDNKTLFNFGGKVLGAFGTMYSAAQQSRSLRSQARALERQAQQTKERGIWEQIRFNEESRRVRSAQRALFGESGVQMEGSAADLIVQTRTEQILDRLQMGRNTDIEVANLMADAKELRRAARSARRGGMIGAFSSFF